MSEQAASSAGAVRGEYKVPGGKMVAADVTVTGGRLSAVSISGDFFLEPDDALERIDAALVGQPADAKVAQLTGAIEAALDASVTLVGFSAEAVAIAVRRALGHATGWHDQTFELIHEPPQLPVLHVALDQVLAEELVAGRRGPTLRFWEWVDPAVVIGSFQSLRNEVDPEAADTYGVTVVRRISGGGAMFMEAGNCITFSLVVPASLVDGLTFEQSYAFLDDWVLGALADALDLKPEIRGVRSAQRELQKRFGLDFSSLPVEGLIADLGAAKVAPTSSVHAPGVSMWKPEMLRSHRIREFVKGGSSVPMLMGGDD